LRPIRTMHLHGMSTLNQLNGKRPGHW